MVNVNDKLLEINDVQKNRGVILTITLFFLAIFLHQSNVIFGVNFSFADLFCAIIFMSFAFKQQLSIPLASLLFFLTVSVLVIMTATFYVPYKFLVTPEPMRIINDYTKLIAIFIYFLIGYNLSRLHLMNHVVKWYAIFGIVIGMVGIVFTFLNIKLFSQILFFANTRFKGLMIDPNYFSVLQISVLAYFTRIKMIKAEYKYLSIIITTLAVFASGSKTGIITLFCYLALRIIEYVFTSKKKLGVIITQFFLIAAVILLAPLLISFLSEIALNIPSFARIQYLFTDFGQSISESGSGRDAVWGAAIEIIQQSPFIGTGIGTYSEIGFQLFRVNNVAHNTFLQLCAEWGLPLAICLFSYIFLSIGKITNDRKRNSEMNVILRDMMVILLIGSVAISLNNARVLWLFFGALIAALHKYPTNKEREGMHVK